MHSSSAAVFLMVAALSGACGSSSSSSAPHICTLIGCDNTVQVLLTGAGAPNVLRVEASAPGGTPLTWSCTSNTPCTGTYGVVFDNFAPDTLMVSVVTSSGTTTVTVVPVYTTRNPNGPDCPPACKTATMSIGVSA